MRGKSCDLHHIPTDLTPASPEAPDMVHDVDQEVSQITSASLKCLSTYFCTRISDWT